MVLRDPVQRRQAAGHDPHAPPISEAATGVGASLPADPSCARTARHLVADALASWGRGDLADVAILLTSEVMTNALIHGHSDAELRMSLQDDRVRVEVYDRDHAIPTLRPHDADATWGRGLVLVDALAAAWGTVLGIDGKTVWFELA